MYLTGTLWKTRISLSNVKWPSWLCDIHCLNDETYPLKKKGSTLFCWASVYTLTDYGLKSHADPLCLSSPSTVNLPLGLYNHSCSIKLDSSCLAALTVLQGYPTLPIQIPICRDGERHSGQQLLHPHEQQDGACEESLPLYTVLFGGSMVFQTTCCLHVLPDLHWLPHQCSHSDGHSSEQEAAATTQLHPGQPVCGWTDHGLLWIHSRLLFFSNGLFLLGTNGLCNWRIHGYSGR